MSDWPGDLGGDPRRARAARRRARRRTLVLGIAGAVAIGASVVGALVLVESLRVGGDEEPAVADGKASQFEGLEPVELQAAECRSPLTPDEPLRLWIGGDSLAGSLGPALGELVAETGVVAPVFDSRISSGLASPDFFDWPQHATEELERLDPEVVVFIIGTNDFEEPSDRPVDDAGEPAWKAEYRLLVAQMLDVLNGDDDERPVYWIGAPPIQDRHKDEGVREINEVAKSVIAEHPEAAYVDEYALFADEDGKYASSKEDASGRSVRVRAGDGIHFTPAGGQVLGESVFASLDRRCDLDAQAVEGADQDVVQAPGSGKLPGSTPGTSGTTVVTDPPSTSPPTAPPTTLPPTTAVTLLPDLLNP